MKLLPLVALALTASPAFAQSRLYTNADLASTPVTRWTRTVTAEELASLEAHQYHAPTVDRELGPQVVIANSSPTEGPYGEFAPFTPFFFRGATFEVVGPLYGGYGFGGRGLWSPGFSRTLSHPRRSDPRAAVQPRSHRRAQD